VILGLAPGDPREGDHINGNRLDCRRENLRIVTPAQNRHNRAAKARGASQHRGVDRFRGKWRARGSLNGRCVFLGLFVEEEDAAAAASAWRLANMSHTNEARTR
jgi:hypothetical protein